MDRDYIDPSVFVKVWEEAVQSIWAVNIAGSGKFGRSLEPEAIATQAATVHRDVSVTRVFVIEQSDSAESRQALRQVVTAQLRIGIKIYIINRADFDTAKGMIETELGSEDFVIVDGNTIYVSEAGGKKFALRSSQQLAYAQTVCLRIQRAAAMVSSLEQMSWLIPID